MVGGCSLEGGLLPMSGAGFPPSEESLFVIHSCSSRGSGDDSRLSPVADGLCPVYRPVSQQAAFGGPRRMRTRLWLRRSQWVTRQR